MYKRQLYDKIEDETAQTTDAESVKTLWNKEKENLHVIVPHTNIANIDYWLSEAIGLIETKKFDLALSKVCLLYTSVSDRSLRGGTARADKR